MKDRIKEVRQAVGLTQPKFAERIAISTSYLAGMELGTKTINERTLRLLCVEYGVDEQWLRTGEGSMFSGETDGRVIKATSIFKSLNPQLQDFALTMLNELSELGNFTDMK
ncbi:MAG: helix-turn-helix domain-containing protein [Holosporales bacterium]|jgi:transcriptional regulator with XRE-family HTH domain|nr:helix-turn-helix domain-containing protein [Holosporales bacterium]